RFDCDWSSDVCSSDLAGRGSFIESFPLFGYDLNDYDTLFGEKLQLLLHIRDNERVTWQGEHRAPLQDQGIYPRTPNQIPIWVARSEERRVGKEGRWRG